MDLEGAKKFWGGHLSIQELERREIGAQRLRERLSPLPHYAEAAARIAEQEGTDDNYWRRWYASSVLA